LGKDEKNCWHSSNTKLIYLLKDIPLILGTGSFDEGEPKRKNNKNLILVSLKFI